ncbi:hypothetical protein G7046_g1203 [Stylonectria norvegica]|nr:hypothetical protein G7046_g1203 [Stylonectria norvegica]
MPSSSKCYTLRSGGRMPAVGLGTWQSQSGEVEHAVQWAIQAGYRHIDTAFAYGNEKEVGLGIKASGVPREEIWLTTKLDNQWHKRVLEALGISLENLGTDYVDLYLMHWPVSLDPLDENKIIEDWDYIDTWCKMQQLVSSGKVRNIGVSNFGVYQLERLLADERCTIVPAVNQVELHPYNPSTNLLAYNNHHNIHTTAYSPLGSTNSPLYRNQTITSIAQYHRRTPQQVLLMWGIQRGTSVLPKSVTKSRIEANWDLEGWRLRDEDMFKLSAIQDRFKVAGDDWLPVRVFLDDEKSATKSLYVSNM